MMKPLSCFRRANGRWNNFKGTGGNCDFPAEQNSAELCCVRHKTKGVSMIIRITARIGIIALALVLFLQIQVHAETCEKVVHEFNARLSSGIDEQELVLMLRSLNSTNNKKLPPRFVTKKKARSLGWKPGKDLWSVPALRGESIGGDRFSNREGRLPANAWREADLDYKGGHCGAKRLVFSRDGLRFVTVDHYRTFSEVPSCR
jgi:ribonuclease T1